MSAIQVAVISGKGGVGKTSLTANLAITLAGLGRRVVLVDGDLALGKIDLLFGAEPRFHVGHVLAGRCDVREALLMGPFGMSILPGGCGLGDLAVLGRRRRGRLEQVLRTAGAGAEFLLLDLATGLGPDTVDLAARSDRTLLVTTPELTSLTDAYAVLKTLAVRRAPVPGVVVNRVRDLAEAQAVHRRIAETAERYLGQTPEFLGCIPEDAAVRRAVEAQSPFVLQAPDAPASRAVRALARRLVGSGGPDRDLALVPPFVRSQPVLEPQPVSALGRVHRSTTPHLGDLSLRLAA